RGGAARLLAQAGAARMRRHALGTRREEMAPSRVLLAAIPPRRRRRAGTPPLGSPLRPRGRSQTARLPHAGLERRDRRGGQGLVPPLRRLRDRGRGLRVAAHPRRPREEPFPRSDRRNAGGAGVSRPPPRRARPRPAGGALPPYP